MTGNIEKGEKLYSHRPHLFYIWVYFVMIGSIGFIGVGVYSLLTGYFKGFYIFGGLGLAGLVFTNLLRRQVICVYENGIQIYNPINNKYFPYSEIEYFHIKDQKVDVKIKGERTAFYNKREFKDFEEFIDILKKQVPKNVKIKGIE